MHNNIIYFYYDQNVPLLKGHLSDRPAVTEQGQEYVFVDWINDNDRCVGHSYVPKENIFSTREECLSFAKNQRSQCGKKAKLYKVCTKQNLDVAKNSRDSLVDIRVLNPATYTVEDTITIALLRRMRLQSTKIKGKTNTLQ